MPTLNRREFLDALLVATKAAPSRSVVPILDGIFMQTRDGILELCCSDLEFHARATVPYEGELLTVVPAKTLLDIVRHVAEDITLEQDGGKLILSSGKARYELSTMSESEFPLFPSLAGEAFEIGGLKELVSRVMHAVSRDDVRPALLGVHFKLSGGILHVAATDGFRLATAEETVEADGECEAIIPHMPLRAASQMTGTVKVTITENQAAFECGNTTYVTRLIDAQFPAYERVIGETFVGKVRFKTQELKKAVERVSVLSADTYGSVCLSFADGITVEARASVGTARETIEAAKEGEPETVHCRSKYLLEALGATPEEEVVLCLSGGLQPIQIRPIEGTWRQIIMPVTPSQG